MKRRELLVVGTVGAVAAVAGCSSETESDETTGLGNGEIDTENEFAGNGETDETYTQNDETRYVEKWETIEGFTDRGVSVRDIYLKGPTPESLERVFVPVENTRDEEIAGVRVAVDFYDGDTRIDSGQEMVQFLGSGENATVSIAVRKDYSGRISHAGVRTTITVTPTTPLNDGEVAVTDESFNRKDERPIVSGRIENTTDEELARVDVHVNFYDGDELVDWQRDGIRRLAVGSAERWDVRASRHADGSRIDDYKRRITVQT